MYTKEDLNVQRVKLDKKYDNLPIIVLDVNQPGTKKTRVCGFYREYKSSISGFDSPESQQERLTQKLDASIKQQKTSTMNLRRFWTTMPLLELSKKETTIAQP